MEEPVRTENKIGQLQNKTKKFGKMRRIILISLLVVLLNAANGKVINNREERITGGAPVELGEIPYFAFIIGRGSIGVQQCGGSLLRYNWVLTAAHCLDAVFFETVEVSLGLVNRFAQPAWHSGPLRNESFTFHPDYQLDPILRNDVGLIHLRTLPSILDHPHIGLATLPLPSDANINLVGRIGTASGFGADITGQISNVLNAVDLTVINDFVCQNIYSSWFTADHICTNNPGAQSICVGDNGGPFVFEIEPNRRVVMGFVSFTIQECRQGFPGSFLRVNPYLPWILSVIDGRN